MWVYSTLFKSWKSISASIFVAHHHLIFKRVRKGQWRGGELPTFCNSSFFYGLEENGREYRCLHFLAHLIHGMESGPKCLNRSHPYHSYSCFTLHPGELIGSFPCSCLGLDWLLIFQLCFGGLLDLQDSEISTGQLAVGILDFRTKILLVHTLTGSGGDAIRGVHKCSH